MAKITDPALLAILNGGAAPKIPAANQPVAGNSDPTPSSTLDTPSLLRDFEGYRDTPYWDVNALRTGYGSDTVTRADGSVVPVTEGMQITRDDAERDLSRRSKEFTDRARGQVGADVWDALPANARAALGSTTYNYGSLPASVVQAAKSGDVNAIADAVYGLRGQNDGVNAQRREKEAAIIRGQAYTPSSAAADDGARSTQPVGGKKVTDPSVLALLNAPSSAPQAAAPADAGLTTANITVAPQQTPGAPAIDPYLADLPIPGTVNGSTPRPAGEVILGGLQKDLGDINGMVMGAVDSIGNAITGPGRALNQDPAMMPQIDPQTGAVNPTPPAMISAAVDTAGLALGNGPGMAERGMISQPTNAAAVAATKSADEFGIPLTQGQAGKSLQQLTQEELLRQGDGAASKIIRNFDTTQADAIGGAVNKMSGNLGAGAADMGQTVMGALNKIVSDTKKGATDLYDKAFGSNLKIRTSALGDLPSTVAQKLYDDGILVDTQAGGVTPVAAFALQQIDRAKEILSGIAPSSLPGDGANITAVSLRSIEQIRKRLVQLEGSTPEDRRAVRAIKDGFDNWLDDTVDRMLITGDDEALAALKDARTEWGKYKKLSTADTGDQAMNAVVKMQKQDATAEEVANWVYGANIASPSLAAPKVAARIKGIVGEDSDAWKAIRASAFERLTMDAATDTPRTALMISKRIDQFLNDKGTTLSRVLFSDEERAAMDRLSTTLKSTVTPKDATNPSRSGHTILNAVKKVAGPLLLGLSATTGNIGGIAAAMALPVFAGRAAKTAATKAIKRVEPIAPIKAAPYSNANVLLRGNVLTNDQQPAPPDKQNVLTRLEA